MRTRTTRSRSIQIEEPGSSEESVTSSSSSPSPPPKRRGRPPISRPLSSSSPLPTPPPRRRGRPPKSQSFSSSSPPTQPLPPPSPPTQPRRRGRPPKREKPPSAPKPRPRRRISSSSSSEESSSRSPSPKPTTTKKITQKRQHESKENNKRTKKPKLAPFKFYEVPNDPIIETLKNVSCYQRNLNLAAVILDQIALEGLAGITLNYLYNIIDALDPNLKCVQSEDTQAYVWNIIVRRHLQAPPGYGVRAYAKKESESRADKDGNHHKPAKKVRINTLKLPELAWKRVSKTPFALYPLEDGLIKGSCENYLKRVDITDDIIDEFLTSGAKESLHQIHSDYNLDEIHFVADHEIRRRAILPEWSDPNADIKMREYAALEFIGRTRTHGAVFPNDKKLGRYRIILSSKGYITQYQQHNQDHIVHHLKRFARANLKYIDSSTFNKRGIAKGLNDNKDEAAGNHPVIKKHCCDPQRLPGNIDMLRIVYDCIAESDGRGLLEIRKKLKIPKSHVRNHIKNLISLGMIGSHTKRVGDVHFRLYRTRHRSIKYKRPKKDNSEKLKGVMARWDEIDIKAKSILGHKRSSFTQAEDSLLILCRIVSLLIDPNARKLSFCVKKRHIRNLMHEEFVESHDKTADACLRRITYLKRLPHNIMSINELTAELRDDADVIRLVEMYKSAAKDERQNQLFTQTLRLIRSKLPSLLGFSSTTSGLYYTPSASVQPTGSNYANLRRNIFHRMSSEAPPAEQHRAGGGKIDYNIKNEADLMERFELVDCQSVASIARAPTYERPKNVVDAKLNQACLVTMAYTLTNSSMVKPATGLPINAGKTASCIGETSAPNSSTPGVSCTNDKTGQTVDTNSAAPSTSSGKDTSTVVPFSGLPTGPPKKRASIWLLDKFYANYQDKLVCSVLSKLNKRSLLTRKSAFDQATSYRPIRTRTSLKLNQSVLFLLNRYHTSSLLHLTHPISCINRLDLSESNEMSPIALLSSLCSLNNFNLDLNLSVPNNVIGLDQGNENFKQLLEHSSERTREVLIRFLNRCGDNLRANNDQQKSQENRSQQRQQEDQSHQEQQPQRRSRRLLASASASTTTVEQPTQQQASSDSRRALFLLRHELRSQALDKCGDLSDALVVQPCGIKFSLVDEPKIDGKHLDEYLAASEPKQSSEAREPGARDETNRSDWLVKGNCLSDLSSNTDQLISTFLTDAELESKRIRLEYEARLWKSIDGKVHLKTLFKLIESLLSWTIVNPGVELGTLYRELAHLMPEEHLIELLTLMEKLELIEKEEFHTERSPCFFGYSDDLGASKPTITYEAKSGAHLQYCLLLDQYGVE